MPRRCPQEKGALFSAFAPSYFVLQVKFYAVSHSVEIPLLICLLAFGVWK